MKRILISAGVICGLAVLPLAARQSAPKLPPGTAVAFVSGQRVMTESTPGKAWTTRFQAAQQQKAAELRTKQQALETTRQQLVTADAASRAALQKQELAQRADLERSTAQAQVDLQTLQRQMNAEIQEQLRQTIEDIVKGTGIQLVVNNETAVIWASPQVDLTAAVIERMNTRK